MVAAGGRQQRRNRQPIDWILWGVPLGLTFVAGILIASTQREAEYAVWYQHWITAAVGVVLALLLARVPIQRLLSLQWPIYGLTVASLIAVRVIGTSALGAQSWINIGGFYVQPSEFAKLAAILLLAGVLARYPVERPVDLLRPAAVISLPWVLVFVQPDLGTSLVFAAMLLTMLFWAGMPLAWVVLLLVQPLLVAAGRSDLHRRLGKLGVILAVFALSYLAASLSWYLMEKPLASLKPNEDRLAFSAVFILDKQAGVLERTFSKSVINSDKRFSYEEAQTVLDGFAAERND
jgi:peptidoglycan/LPS O-acetylase OafA/YrhL